MIRRFIGATATVGAALLALATPAFALDCHNISRNVSPAEYNFATTNSAFEGIAFPVGVDPANNDALVFWNVMPMFKGNWYLLAISENGPEPQGSGVTTLAVYWGFIPPGTVPFFPGGHGNYTNGQVDDLLGMAACPQVRQILSGIQSGACGQLQNLGVTSGP